jgi:Ca-activated chloride channel family protein
VELTGPFAGAALALLTLGGLLGIRWHGRIL